MDGTNAAQNLTGRVLTTGWQVIEKIEKGDNSTGGNFSVSYRVKKNNEECFLKAFDINKFIINNKEKPFFDVMQEMASAYNYERDLSIMCQGRHITKVIYVKDYGEERLEEFAFSIVPYLIFDLAEGDIRRLLDFSKKLDYAWCFNSLHSVAVGLKQLHTINISHQDIKPSNILVFKNESKIGDLGRSLCLTLDGPYSKLPFCGQLSYAPPEIMYGFYENDWQRRVFATDCYLFGSLIVFYLTGVTFNTYLFKNIPEEIKPHNIKIRLEEFEPYLLNAFDNAIREIGTRFENEFFKNDIIYVVEKLCYPFPDKRGHPKNIINKGAQYSMERFVTIFDVLLRKARIKYFNKKA